MNPIKAVTRPVRHLANAVVMPFKAVFVVGLCWLINAMTSPGHWWVQWVALGMGIAVLASLGRALKSLLLLALVAWVGWKVYQRYGEGARREFDEWVQRASPKAAELVAALRPQARA